MDKEPMLWISSQEMFRYLEELSKASHMMNI